MELQVGVKVLLKNPEGKYLMLRRAGHIDAAGKWDMPGGRINIGSALMENLAREVMEETGMTMRGTPTLVAAQDIFVKGKELHVVRLTYTGTVEGEPHLSDEHSAHAWFTLDEIRKLDNLDTYLKELFESGTI
jgi:8-oxo-dGTP diphosphatase